jgi:hypothetical protein
MNEQERIFELGVRAGEICEKIDKIKADRDRYKAERDDWKARSEEDLRAFEKCSQDILRMASELTEAREELEHTQDALTIALDDFGKTQEENTRLREKFLERLDRVLEHVDDSRCADCLGELANLKGEIMDSLTTPTDPDTHEPGKGGHHKECQCWDCQNPEPDKGPEYEPGFVCGCCTPEPDKGPVLCPDGSRVTLELAHEPDKGDCPECGGEQQVKTQDACYRPCSTCGVKK